MESKVKFYYIAERSIKKTKKKVHFRIGEPLWAETARLLVRFVLLAMLIILLIALIIRAATSPLVIQHSRTPVHQVQVPGM
jgi:hypothetical protein